MSYPVSMNDRAYEIHEWAKRQGFYDGAEEDPSFIPRCLALIHSEVSEALEAWRDDDPDHLSEELADIIIRTLDTAEYLGVNIEQEVINKHQRNLARPRLNGRVR